MTLLPRAERKPAIESYVADLAQRRSISITLHQRSPYVLLVDAPGLSPEDLEALESFAREQGFRMRLSPSSE